MPTNHTTPNTHPEPDLVEATAPLVLAFEATRAEREALASDDFADIHLDLHRAATIATAAYRQIEPLLPELTRKVPDLDVALVKSIPAKADALHHAQNEYKAALTPDPELPGLHAEADTLRDLFVDDLSRAAARGTIAGDRLAEVQKTNGYRVVASDLGILTNVAREEWAALGGKTSITEAELERAEKLVARLWHAVAEIEEAPSRRAAASEARVRAFTLLDRAYDVARRAVSYARWREGDAESVAPSLRTQKGRAQGARGEKAPEAGASVTG